MDLRRPINIIIEYMVGLDDFKKNNRVIIVEGYLNNTKSDAIIYNH